MNEGERKRGGCYGRCDCKHRMKVILAHLKEGSSLDNACRTRNRGKGGVGGSLRAFTASTASKSAFLIPRKGAALTMPAAHSSMRGVSSSRLFTAALFLIFADFQRPSSVPNACDRFQHERQAGGVGSQRSSFSVLKYVLKYGRRVYI
jgi:hypothetical protein